eukprot:767636-Hanusia_phi.AAC.4
MGRSCGGVGVGILGMIGAPWMPRRTAESSDLQRVMRRGVQRRRRRRRMHRAWGRGGEGEKAKGEEEEEKEEKDMKEEEEEKWHGAGEGRGRRQGKRGGGGGGGGINDLRSSQGVMRSAVKAGVHVGEYIRSGKRRRKIVEAIAMKAFFDISVCLQRTSTPAT